MGVLVVLGGVVAGLLIVGGFMDWRARRRGRRIDIDGAGLSADRRELRRDIRSWMRGSSGNSGEDLSWMTWRRLKRR